MPDTIGLSHLYVRGHVLSKERSSGLTGGNKVRTVDRSSHGRQLLREANAALASSDHNRALQDFDEEFRATGAYLALESADADFKLELDRLTSMTKHQRSPKRPRWLLLSAQPAMNDIPETAVIWVADDFKQEFLKLFEDYLNADGPSGKPKNNALVANTSHIRAAFLRNLWTSNSEPLRGTLTWWEVWLDEQRAQHVPLNKILNAFHIRRLDRETRIDTSLIVYVYATWEQLEPLTATKLPLTEIRTPAFILDTIEDLSDAEQTEYVIDLAGRVDPAPPEAPAVCHLDTGVFRGHQLISGSLASSDQHTIVDPYGNDRNGHGTSMAGLALYGDHLDDLLTGTQGVRLRHRLESVRILTGGKDPVPQNTDPRDYASGTISAVSLPETTSSRKRVYCMPISAKPDAKPGRPTLWSAAVDALAAGTNIVIADATIGLISKPDPDTSRLFIVSTANVDEYRDDYLENSDLSPIEDPGQSWNALTVGAYTDLDRVPTDPMFENYRPISPRGELSPHSRTSLLFGDRPWPIKPEICLEGGNVLTDGRGMFEERNPLVFLRSVGIRNDVALTSANATSAATAQAARLAALAMDRYPSYWPETIRGLLTHEAEWTAPMRVQLDACGGKKTKRVRLLRRYGWGVPTDKAVLTSTHRAVTMVVQDEFRPFDDKYRLRELRLHSLPWPRETLESLGEDDVRLRITLSYFIEPSATRRGWRGKYTYASHGLRFDLQDPMETANEFLARINRQAVSEEDKGAPLAGSSHSNRWLLGERSRNHGSLHRDEWTGTGVELAACNNVVVYPVGGWWKNNRRRDRQKLPVRYALLISLSTRAQRADLYTPIMTQLEVPVSTTIVEV